MINIKNHNRTFRSNAALRRKRLHDTIGWALIVISLAGMAAFFALAAQSC
jgi:hypothetical protein